MVAGIVGNVHRDFVEAGLVFFKDGVKHTGVGIGDGREKACQFCAGYCVTTGIGHADGLDIFLVDFLSAVVFAKLGDDRLQLEFALKRFAKIGSEAGVTGGGMSVVGTYGYDGRSVLNGGINDVEVEGILRVDLLVDGRAVFGRLHIAGVEGVRVLKALVSRSAVVVAVLDGALVEAVLGSLDGTGDGRLALRSFRGADGNVLGSLFETILQVDVGSVGEVDVGRVDGVEDRTGHALDIPLAGGQCFGTTFGVFIGEHDVGLAVTGFLQGQAGNRAGV